MILDCNSEALDSRHIEEALNAGWIKYGRKNWDTLLMSRSSWRSFIEMRECDKRIDEYSYIHGPFRLSFFTHLYVPEDELYITGKESPVLTIINFT